MPAGDQCSRSHRSRRGRHRVTRERAPHKPIRFIVPGAPGGGTDAMARLVANAMAASRKWQFVVENMPGAGGNIGLESVVRAAKDGYTIGLGESSNLIINPYLYSQLPLSVETDLEPIILVAKVPFVLVVGADSRHDSVPGSLRPRGRRHSHSRRPAMGRSVISRAKRWKDGWARNGACAV